MFLHKYAHGPVFQLLGECCLVGSLCWLLVFGDPNCEITPSKNPNKGKQFRLPVIYSVLLRICWGGEWGGGGVHTSLEFSNGHDRYLEVGSPVGIFHHWS